jgi:hypothetical protein
MIESVTSNAGTTKRFYFSHLDRDPDKREVNAERGTTHINRHSLNFALIISLGLVQDPARIARKESLEKIPAGSTKKKRFPFLGRHGLSFLRIRQGDVHETLLFCDVLVLDAGERFDTGPVNEIQTKKKNGWKIERWIDRESNKDLT